MEVNYCYNLDNIRKILELEPSPLILCKPELVRTDMVKLRTNNNIDSPSAEAILLSPIQREAGN
jgi:hypothetical protein